MNRVRCAAVAALSSLVVAAPAQADSFTPANSTRTFSGTLTLGGSIILNCTVSITIQTNAAGNDAEVTAASITGSLCATLVPSGFGWNIDVLTPLPPPTNVTAATLQVSGVVVGGCSGTLVGEWIAGTPSIYFPPGTMLGACQLQGQLDQTGTSSALIITN